MYNISSRDNRGDTQEVNSIKTDIKETSNEYIVVAEIPGAKKEDIKINFNNDMLTVTYESKQSHEVKEENYIRKERRTESISRSYHIENIDIDKATAKYDNGLLSIILPKKEGNVTKGKNILID